MKTFIICLILVVIWAWFGENLPSQYNLNPLDSYNIDQRLSYYATPIIIGLLLRRKNETKI